MVGLSFIEPELREGYNEIAAAAQGTLPVLITVKDIRGELHAHSTSSDGFRIPLNKWPSRRARTHGYEYYIGITDHSQQA